MFNLTGSVPKSWQTVSRQADRVTNEAAPVNGATHLPPPRDLGGVLRERREAMGASLAEVETATRIRQKYLAALESDEWHLLPGEVVGRGFLRNYATYLGLDPTEAVDRRRSVADPLLSTSLSGTSAGSALPPERDVDYRPKDVFLRDEPEGIQQRELRVGPFFRVVTVIGVLLLFWWVASNFSGEISAGVNNLIAAIQTRTADQPIGAGATPDANQTADTSIVTAGNDEAAITTTATQAEQDTASGSAPSNNQPVVPNPSGQADPAQSVAVVPTEPAQITILIPTNTPAALAEEPIAESASEAPAAEAPVAEAPAVEAPVVEVPEPTPLPTDTPVPPPTATPLPVPTDTPVPPPTEAPPPVVAASCVDSSMAFFSPGVNQVLSGAVAVTGRAVPTDKGMEYYKLEFAPGANAEGGYVYFAGTNAPVDGGTLGTFDTTGLPNGAYTIQLTVVDLTGNYPTPCRTSVVIQN